MPSHHVFLGTLGRKCSSLLSSSLQEIVLELIEEPVITRDNIVLGEPRAFSLAEAIVYKECFGGRFSGTASAKFDTVSSPALDRESAVRTAINTAILKLPSSRKLSEDSISAYLLSPVLGKKATLVTNAQFAVQQRKGDHINIFNKLDVLVSSLPDILCSHRQFAGAELERPACA